LQSLRFLFAAFAATAALTLLAGCSASGALNAFTPYDTHALTVDQAYGPHARQRFDVYRPLGSAPAAGWPMVVFFYGGSWNTGARADYRFVGEALASRGVLTLIADYRLYPEVRYPDFLDDSALAVAHALEQAGPLGADPRRIFVMGHSAGAYNAAMVAIDARWLARTKHAPRELAGFIGLAGPYDFLPTGNRDAQPVFFHPNYPTDSQPVQHVQRGAPPVFLGYAASDSLVRPEKNTLPLAALLRRAEVPVRVVAYPRANHLTVIGAFARPLRWLVPVLDDVVAFVGKPVPAAP